MARIARFHVALALMWTRAREDVMKRFAIVGVVAALMAGCVRVEYPAQSAAQPSQALPNGYAQPVHFTQPLQPVSYATQPAYAQAPIANTQFVPASQVVTRQAVPERVVYQRAPERRAIARPKRSVGTSALIIGSSAAGGAGIGALIGGKKGAGIGALAGGGAAALWDQITRHKQ
jgi:hypothetical protein